MPAAVVHLQRLAGVDVPAADNEDLAGRIQTSTPEAAEGSVTDVSTIPVISGI